MDICRVGSPLYEAPGSAASADARVEYRMSSYLKSPIAASRTYLERPMAASRTYLKSPIAASRAYLERPLAATSTNLERPIAASRTYLERPIAASRTYLERPIAATRGWSAPAMSRETGRSRRCTQAGIEAGWFQASRGFQSTT